MNTPICDFVQNYAESGQLRFHMPGHKGKGMLGVESRDITEIEGADVLYRAKGIIKGSEENAARLRSPSGNRTVKGESCAHSLAYENCIIMLKVAAAPAGAYLNVAHLLCVVALLKGGINLL